MPSTTIADEYSLGMKLFMKAVRAPPCSREERSLVQGWANSVNALRKANATAEVQRLLAYSRMEDPARGSYLEAQIGVFRREEQEASKAKLRGNADRSVVHDPSLGNWLHV